MKENKGHHAVRVAGVHRPVGVKPFFHSSMIGGDDNGNAFLLRVFYEDAGMFVHRFHRA